MRERGVLVDRGRAVRQSSRAPLEVGGLVPDVHPNDEASADARRHLAAELDVGLRNRAGARIKFGSVNAERHAHAVRAYAKVGAIHVGVSPPLGAA